MRFKVDENLPVEVAELLSRARHDAITVIAQHLSGKPDSEIAGICQREKRVLVTLDLDFADLTKYPPREYAGLLVIRIANQHKAGVLAVLDRILPLLTSEVIDGKIWIADERRVRVREA